MIRGFEKYTEELSKYEKKILIPIFIRSMKNKIGKENAITNIEAVTALKKAGYKTSGPRFRKIMHVLRVSGMLKNVIATSRGYYISNSAEETLDYIKSLDERIKHIQNLQKAICEQFYKLHENSR